MTIKLFWEPGNGARYDLIVVRFDDRNFIAWMRKGGSGGVAIMFEFAPHWTYIAEKLDAQKPDAKALEVFCEVLCTTTTFGELKAALPGVVRRT